MVSGSVDAEELVFDCVGNLPKHVRRQGRPTIHRHRRSSGNVDGAGDRIEHAEHAAASRHVADEAAGRHDAAGSLRVHLADDGAGGRVHLFEVDAVDVFGVVDGGDEEGQPLGACGGRSSGHVRCCWRRHGSPAEWRLKRARLAGSEHQKKKSMELERWNAWD